MDKREEKANRIKEMEKLIEFMARRMPPSYPADVLARRARNILSTGGGGEE